MKVRRKDGKRRERRKDRMKQDIKEARKKGRKDLGVKYEKEGGNVERGRTQKDTREIRKERLKEQRMLLIPLEVK